MTCIVGLVHAGKVLIGGDSAGSNGWNMVDRSDRKVFANSGFLFGFTTSYRMGQLIRYAFTPPQREAKKDLAAYMVTDFIDSLRKCLKDGGYAKKESEVETGGTFLVGHQGRLFRIENDYQVGESADGYFACGCGESYALGAIFASAGKQPKERVQIALKAAAKHSGGVRGPFHIESI